MPSHARVILAGLAGLLCARADASEFQLQDLFATAAHDFGSVAKGAEAAHVFELRNTTAHTVHIKSVKSSCDCTVVSVSRHEVAPGGTSHIRAKLDTTHYVGRRAATLTVLIDQPQLQEATLRLSGYIRGDIEVHPSSANFGTVMAGEQVQKTLEIVVRRRGCDITNVVADDRYFEVSVKKKASPRAAPCYKLSLKLKDSAPSGVLHSPIEVQVSDRRVRRLVFFAEGNITGPLSVCENLVMGTVMAGGQCQSNLVVRGTAPFTVSDITCSDPRFTFEISRDEPLKVHVIRVTFRSATTDEHGTFEREVTIHATMDSGHQSCRALLSGVVRVK